ncbi:uncharacterized protein LOC141764477 isoform X2 [Sebastes fasciatus]
MDRCCCCHVCGKKLSNSRALQRHQRTHSGAKAHTCSHCGTAFRFLNRLKRHILIHTKEEGRRLKEHLGIHGWSAEAEETTEALGGLDTARTPIDSDMAHLERKSAGKTADVTLPGDTHTAMPAKPERNHSPKTTPTKRQTRTESEELVSCAECSKGFQSVYARDRHLREKHSKHPLHKCYDCGQTFKVSRNLKVHRRVCHPAPAAAVGPEEERRAPKTPVCSTCGKQFPTSASLRRHLIIHSGKKPYQCTLCERGFSQIGNLKTHQKIHKGKFTNMAALEKSSPQPEEAQSSVEICFCHLCWTQFSEKQLLEEHLKQVHESKKPFSCTQCGKRFMNVQKLEEHKAGHQGLNLHRCSQCDKGFQTSKGLENHMRDHTGEKPFPCVICGKRFKQDSTLRAHHATHSGERPHLCSICGKCYVRAEELKVHLRVHTGEKPYQCDECGKSFYYRQGYNSHKKTHSAKPMGPTRQLGRPRQLGRTRKKIPQRAPPDSDGEDLTREPPDLGNRPQHHLGNQENHAAENHSQTSAWNGGHHTAFNLSDKNPTTSHWSAAEGHHQAYGDPAGASIDFSALLRGTAGQEHFKESCPAEQPSWPSGTSSVTPSSELGLPTLLPHNTTSETMHLSNKTGPEVNPHEELRPETQQDQDHRTAPTEETLRQPEPEHSSSQEKPFEEPKQCQEPRRLKKNYDCPTCGRVFLRNTALQRHLMIHLGKRPFKCFICGRGFTQSGNLKTHMKVHKGELPNWTLVQEKSPPKESLTVHVCGKCGMDFPQKQQLELHRESHKKPYACPDCGKTFKNEYYFKIHKRIHSGDSPFLCSECGKSCVTADSLKKHELTHTGEKNFHCDQCGRAFSQSSHLNVHLKTHTGERPHLCSICGKSYSKACDLKVHLRVHTGEKPYTCEKCGKCFYYSQGYQAHLKIHDKKPKPQTKPLGRPKQQPIVVKNQ